MKIAVVIITVDRVPGNNYLSNTLESLRASGACDDTRFSIDIYHSGAERSNLDISLIKNCNATLHLYETKTHTNLSSYNALNIAVNRNPEYVVFLEDDIDVCSDFPDFICSQIDLNPTAPIIDFISYYDEIRDAYFSGERFLDMNAMSFTAHSVSRCRYSLLVVSANILIPTSIKRLAL